MDTWAVPGADTEANLEGLNGRSASELTDAMVKLKDSPGSQNGTGLLQAVIAMKIREVYDKLTALTPA
jgi:phosphoribulokinase